MIEYILVINFALDISWMIFWEKFGSFLNFLEKGLLILGLHGENRFSDEFENVDVFAEFKCHLVGNFEIGPLTAAFFPEFLV